MQLHQAAAVMALSRVIDAASTQSMDRYTDVCEDATAVYV
jgi:hypothetical protein